MARPAGYPLPWCAVADEPYWKLNARLCSGREWAEWQRASPMSKIIPEIDRLLA